MPETNRHLELRTLLYQILKREFSTRATLGSSQFVYFDPRTSATRLAPDVFVRLGRPHTTFRVWKIWQWGAPDLAVEVVSDSDEGEEDWAAKLERYRAAGIGEVVRFDPDNAEQPIRVWDHLDGDLVERDLTDGVVDCVALGLYWVVLPDVNFVRVLRLARDRDGKNLLPTSEEAEKAEAQARAEEARARAEEARARARAEAEVAELRRQLAEHQVKSNGKVLRKATKKRSKKV
ncbi:MAG: Uma2 family endonuclease [Polyangiaceae bacterium]|nr:Uma2 family endonuclease [Polyangiaceae bacterium]